ncbi:porin [bacterium]|nr:porin [bacterium]
MKKLLSFLVAILMIALMTPVVKGAISVNGHLSVGLDMVEQEGTNQDSAFVGPKANINISNQVGDVSTKVEVRINKPGAATFSIREAVVSIANLMPNLTVKVGKLSLPVEESIVVSFDNANNMDNILISSDSGRLDAGLALDYKVNDQIITTLAYTNGDRTGNDTGKKTLCLKVATSGLMPNLTLDGSYYSKDKDNIMDLYATYNLTTLGLKINGIYVTKEIKDIVTLALVETNYMGGEVSYAIANTPCSLAARYTVSNPKGDNNNTNLMAIGANYKLADQTKVQIEYMNKELDDNIKDSSDSSGLNLLVCTAF